MRRKTTCKIAVDVAMTVLLLLQMAFMLIGQEKHEWLGICMFLLFVLHNILNFKWYKSLLKGRYTLLRSMMTVLNLLALACMMGLIVSGIIMSRHVVVFLHISKGMSFARELHMFTAYWGFVLMSAHLGMHWNMVLNIMRRAARVSVPLCTASLRVSAVLVAAYGAYALIKHQIPSYLFRQNIFAFFDYSQPAIQFVAEYVSMLGLCVFVVHYGAKLLQNIVLKK